MCIRDRPKTLSEFLRENIDTQFVTQLFKEENMLNAIKETVPRLWSLLSESVNLLFSFFTFFLILLYIVFILLDYESIAEGWTHLVPDVYKRQSLDLARPESTSLVPTCLHGSPKTYL